ncbi:hypothetical protein SAMN05444161_6682 [Rhizobiales bacterium GAS191]|jgi:hypothetical protein|nr:hypothetical protein SAMN05519103_05839 [Rhizobiales bacterium GAS113]SDR64261.1 hypothetical protein SAMN05519103_09591 [Rhizobiales bacterium GAS113]SEE68163.1 hypothetical protein SAMN05444161_6682 [Rhizobiales bacterium GAS191]
MDKANEYRECAAQCIRLARTADDLRDKALLIAMAERWCDLADRVTHSAILEDYAPKSQERPAYLN